MYERIVITMLKVEKMLSKARPEKNSKLIFMPSEARQIFGKNL